MANHSIMTQEKGLCPLFGTCGGCQYQDIPYEQELALKGEELRKLLKEALSLEDGVFEVMKPSPEAFHYRSRLDLTLRKRNNGECQMGFMVPGTQRLQEVTACLLARREIDDFLPLLKEQAVRKLPPDYRVANLVVRVGEAGNVFWGGIGRRSLRMKEDDYFWVKVHGRKIFYSLDTFFQANHSILENVVARIEALVPWNKETVLLDLYSGVGLFGIALAARAKEVIMVEECADSVKLADYNVRYHHLDHVRILEGKVETYLPDILKEVSGNPCAGVIDPPRGGLASSVIEALVKAENLTSLFYLSCSPESLVRDLKGLIPTAWQVQKVMPFDFFPRTRHLETLVWLVRT